MAPKAPPTRPQQPKKFAFINQEGPERGVRKEVRSHVMREHKRQQRQEQARVQRGVQLARQRGSVEDEAEELDESSKRRRKPSTRRESTSETVVSSTSEPQYDFVTMPISNSSPPTGAETVVALERSSRLIQTSLSSHRRDVFDSFPIKLTQQDFELVDYWLSHFPEMIHVDSGTINGQALAVTHKIFFPAAMSNAWAFETTVLLFAALHKAKMTGEESNEQTSLHRVRSMRLAHQGIEEFVRGGLTNDGDVVAFLSLTTAEYLHGSKIQSLMHLCAVRQYMRRRREAGVQPMKQHTEIMFIWFNALTTFCGYYSASTNLKIRAELQSDLDALLLFLREARDLAMLQSSGFARECMPLRASAFTLGTPLDLALEPSFPDNIDKARDYRCIQLVIMLFIHATLLEYHDSLAQSERYLRVLVGQVGSARPDQSSISLSYRLLWGLLTNDQLYTSSRGARVVRVTQVTKRLGYTSICALCDCLRSWLALNEAEALEDDPEWLPMLNESMLEAEVMGPERWRAMPEFDAIHDYDPHMDQCP